MFLHVVHGLDAHGPFNKSKIKNNEGDDHFSFTLFFTFYFSPISYRPDEKGTHNVVDDTNDPIKCISQLVNTAKGTRLLFW